MIRSTAKVIAVKDGRILLNRCRREDGSVYYDLPGGGQRQHEPMEDAAVREVKEETGYTMKNLRFAGMGEEICLDPVLRERFPDYTHRVFHIFTAETDGTDPEAPIETDLGMEGSFWVPLEDLPGLPELFPHGLRERIPGILAGETGVWLGTHYSGSPD